MMIDKVIKSPNFIKRGSPNYYILLHNIIDCNITLADARNVLNVKYPRLSAQIDDAEFYRLSRLYRLLCDLRVYKLKQRLKIPSSRARRACAVLKLMSKERFI